MKTSPLALHLIKEFESLHDGDPKKAGLQPKMDPLGIWTVGYGHALRHPKTGAFLRGVANKSLAYNLFPKLTVLEAESLLMSDLKGTYEPGVLRLITRKDLNDNQFGALVSFYYNCGSHYKNSKGKLLPFALWANVNKGMSGSALKAYWNNSVTKGDGKVLAGLVRRRKSEAILFVDGILNINPK